MDNKELGNTAVCMEGYAWKGLDPSNRFLLNNGGLDRLVLSGLKNYLRYLMVGRVP